MQISDNDFNTCLLSDEDESSKDIKKDINFVRQFLISVDEFREYRAKE